MADDGAPDYRTPSPDAGHEAIRAPLAQAIDDLAAAAAQQAVHDDQIEAALLLCLTAFDFAQTVLESVAPLQQAVTGLAAQVATLQTAVDDLTGRVTALENPPVAPPDPTPAA